MKKTTLVLALSTAFLSCKKEDKICNCGLVVDDNATNYTVDIRNSCSNNVKTFVLTPGDWMNAHVGSDYCITNVKNW